ncbi:phosphatidylglycerol lysyltransferase domain-containing protein [Frankia sp. ACN1ag]|uniref:phosphatidylglycerol lysyltransferase domain-containing protein n=1 Tax=Frankia sp. ACN1ag TaxID=102891 RepID=UPI0006DC4969|nr:phosphatidylglycerol lysyltransferase domain-containing protein [Frankia sp. ACN1ag]KQC37441.1 hypothetical protein UK82_15700 [Frankia sp. ACN1ag]
MTRRKNGTAATAPTGRRLPGPALIATLTALVGLVDVIGAISHRPTRWTWLGRLIPGVVTQAATGTSVGVGLLLIGLAHGLRRRKRRAWRAAVALSGAAVLLDLARGLAVVPAAIDLVPFAVLVAARRHFPAAGDPRTRWRALGALAALGTADLIVGLSVIRFRHGGGGLAARLEHVLAGLVGVTGPVRFGPGDGDLVAAVLLALGALTVAVPGYLALRPAAPVAALTVADETALRALLARHGGRDSLGYVALRRDRSVLWSPSGKAAISYRVVGGVALAAGDPIGDPEAWPGVIRPFLDLAAAHAWVPAVLGCGPDGGRAYQRAGLRVLELGDEAVVRTAAFSLDGRAMRGVRQAVARVERAGYTARIDRATELNPAERAALADRAAAWRSCGTERGFSMALGRVGAPEDADCVIVRAFQGGRLRGLLTFLPWGPGGLSLDAVRRDRTAANGLTEFMVVALLREADRLGVTRVSLTFAPFRAALAHGERLGATPALRLWRGLLLAASRRFRIESIYRFNAKFDPDWQPRYGCYPTTRDLPRVLFAALRAEALLPRPSFPGRRPHLPSPTADVSSTDTSSTDVSSTDVSSTTDGRAIDGREDPGDARAAAPGTAPGAGAETAQQAPQDSSERPGSEPAVSAGSARAELPARSTGRRREGTHPTDGGHSREGRHSQETDQAHDGGHSRDGARRSPHRATRPRSPRPRHAEAPDRSPFNT